MTPTLFSPTKASWGTLKEMSDNSKMRKKEIADPDKPEDHPGVTEIRNRFVDLVHEMEELNMLEE